jgi:flagellar biosynthesis/type III secretory pathway protein FliH
MAILSGLVAKDLPAALIARRRDIMIESAAYDIIRQEGIQEGIREGIREGIQEGIQEGIIQGIRESLAVLIESKFESESARIRKRLDAISDTDRLLNLFRLIDRARNADEFLAWIESKSR